ncbi:MAG: hypothetical protein ACN2B6_06510 [Rickettsiales bacterium]
MVSALTSYAGSALSISRLDKNPTLTKNLKLQNEPAPAKVDGEAKATSFARNAAAVRTEINASPTAVKKSPVADTKSTDDADPALALRRSSAGTDPNATARKGLTLLFDAISSGLGNGDGNVTLAEINGFFDRVGADPESYGLDQNGYNSLRTVITDVFENIAKISGNPEAGVNSQDFVGSVLNSDDRSFFKLSSVIQFANTIAARPEPSVVSAGNSGDVNSNYEPPVVPIGDLSTADAGDTVEAYKDPVVPIGLPEDAVKALTVLFDGIDPNSDGVITQDEVAQLFADLESRFPKDGTVSSLKTQLTEFFNNAETGDNGVTVNEFISGILGDARAYSSLIALYNRVA